MAKRADVVAERTLYRQVEGGAWKPVRITFERPREQPAGEWGCRYTIEGFEKSAWPATQLIFGVDAVQAFEIARALVDRILMHSRAFTEGRLSWSPDSVPHQLGSFPAPMPYANLKRQRIVRSDLVRTVELEID